MEKAAYGNGKVNAGRKMTRNRTQVGVILDDDMPRTPRSSGFWFHHFPESTKAKSLSLPMAALVNRIRIAHQDSGLARDKKSVDDEAKRPSGPYFHNGNEFTTIAAFGPPSV
jgi:hypothetical protein